MTRKPAAKPTPSEVEVLQVLWERGPSTVREVFDVLGAERSIGYTGALKLMQNMLAKGLVRRDQDQRAHVYAATDAAAEAKQQLVGDMMHRLFGGSASQLVLHLLEDEKASEEEIAEIRRMLAEYKGKTQ